MRYAVTVMQAKIRERIALVVFVCLILVGFGGLIGYLAIGHSWNVAASNIDDAAGSMDGYTVVVYSGTVDPAQEDDDKGDASADKGENGSQASGSQANDPQTGGSQTDNPQASGSQTNGSKAGSPQSGDSQTNDPQTNGSQTGGSQTGSSDAAGGERPLPKDSKPQGGAVDPYQQFVEPKAATDIEAVQESYRAKNATVLLLDVEDLEHYREGTILKKGGYRFGVFSITEADYEYKVRRQVSYFTRYRVDFIVVLTSDMGLVKDVKGIDIVISTKDEGLFVMGETRGNTFYVSAPTLGSVGVILVSPSKVVSAKVIN